MYKFYWTFYYDFRTRKFRQIYFIKTLLKFKIWSYLAYSMIVNEYKRTLFGPVWILINLTIFIVAVGAVYSNIFSVNYFDYLSYMASGMVAWVWISSILTNSGMLYINNSALLRAYPVNKSYLIWSQVFYNFIIFLHQMPIIIVFYITKNLEISYFTFLIIPSLLLVFILNLGAVAILSILVNRFRDIQKILLSSLIVIMITTPIFWKPDMVTGIRELIIY